MKWPDIGIYGGYQGWDLWRSKFKNRPGGELEKGGVIGVRAGYELTRRLGVEAAYGYGMNDFRVFPDTSGAARPSQIGLGARNRHLSLNPIWHFMNSDSKWRPYVTAGVGAMSFGPTESARNYVRTNSATIGAIGTKSNLVPAFNWGGGLKYNLTEMLHLRLDARNIITRQPHLGLPAVNGIPGGIFVAPGGTVGGLQATAGLGFNLGARNSGGGSSSPTSGRASTASSTGGVAATKPTGGRPGKALRVNLAGGSTPIKSDGTAKLIASTDAADPATVKYIWTINGMGTDVTGPEFTFTAKGREPGDYKICSTATTTVKGFEPGSECYTVTIAAQPPVKATVSEPVRVNAGQTTTFTAGADAPAGETVTYEWTMNGQPIAGATGNSYTFNSEGRQPGVYEVCVTAKAHGVASPKQCSSVTVVACTNPTLSIGALPSSEIFAGQRIDIPATAKPGTCGDAVQLSYRAGDGVIGSDGAFDSTNVAFDRTNRSKLQRKSVPVTVTATDSRGNTATAQTSVIVKLAPTAQRLDDVLFASRNSRVNNCGKRVLLEMLAPKLRDDPEAKVVLIGHIDETENGPAAAARRKGKRRAVATVRQLDKARVLNAAAVISAGAGICPTLELSRIKVAYTGKAQGSEMRPTFCGSSTEVRATKRAGAKADTRAPYRRVEVWIVPAGAELPAGVTVQDAPESAIKALNCPK